MPTGVYPRSKESNIKKSLKLKGIKKKPFSEEHKKNISYGHKGQKAWNKNIPMSLETKNKISLSLKGRKVWNKNLKNPYSKETLEKMSISQKERLKNGISEEIKKKISESEKGRTSPMKNRKHSIETRKLISNSNKGKNNWSKGDKNHFWQGGISKLPYPFNFNKELKQLIRTRDNFRCYMCNNPAFCVHHIDYDKNNCSEYNLITLCRSCHTKTNKNRKYWLEFFKFKAYFDLNLHI